VIAIRAVSKAYRAHVVLDGLDLEARPGEVTLLVGANGCGKTTTMRLIAALSPPDSGHIMVAGHDVAGDRTAALAALSFQPQSPRFHPHLTVRQILRFYARLRNLPDSRADAVAGRWGLTGSLGVPTGRLSGGMRQRLALGVLFLPDPPVLLLDEPGLSLDPNWRRSLQSELTGAARRGRTVLVSTHLLGEWDEKADRCLVLDAGRIARELPPDRLREAFPFSVPRPMRAAATAG
jgi:ABC-type multidrug transport system ATPase subunit